MYNINKGLYNGGRRIDKVYNRFQREYTKLVEKNNTIIKQECLQRKKKETERKC